MLWQLSSDLRRILSLAGCSEIYYATMRFKKFGPGCGSTTTKVEVGPMRPLSSLESVLGLKARVLRFVGF